METKTLERYEKPAMKFCSRFAGKRNMLLSSTGSSSMRNVRYAPPYIML